MSLRLFVLSALCLFSGGIAVPLSERADAGLTVTTAQGAVSGTLVTPRVRQFLGIPYASAPRWSPPSPPPVRTGTFSATSFGNTCTQSTGASHALFLQLSGAGLLGAHGQPIVEGDDCQSANIWAPSVNRPQGAAVLLWIYGGSFVFGTTNFDVYQGNNIVESNDDIVVVTINYRTNIFGQPNAPQFNNAGQAQNFGLLDIEAAVKWVYANIAAFGGDPNRITLFGESAGSVAIDAYAYAHTTSSSALIKGIILESGTLDLVLSVPIGKIGSDKADVAAWQKVSVAVGCGSAATDAQLQCMRAVDGKVLEQAILDTDTSFKVIVDGVTIFSDTRKRAAAGNFLKVPTLIGNNRHEGDIFVVALELQTLKFAVPGVTQVVSNAVTKVAFTCPASSAADDRVKAKVPTWRYRYDAVFPDISQRSDLRAYHSSEIPIVFGTYNASTATAGPTADEIALSKYVQSAWVAFARNPVSGLSGSAFAWPEYGASKKVARIGHKDAPTTMSTQSASLVDIECGAIDVLVDAYNDIGMIISLL